MDSCCLTIRQANDINTSGDELLHFESITELKSVENIFELSAPCEILTESPKTEFKNFKKHFKFIRAAGGIVEFENKYLFIHRLGKWDLPKGKMDEGEKPKITALREIEEECGLQGHYVVQKVCNTYHTYKLNGEAILKKTYWYYLKVDGLDSSAMKPQTEEGITDLKWLPIEDFHLVRKNTFESIQIVLDEFLKLKMK